MRRAAKGWKAGELKRVSLGRLASLMSQLLLEATFELRNRMNEEDAAMARTMDQQQAEWMDATRTRQAEAAQAELRGRDSGTQEWKEARGEVGEKGSEG